MAKEYKIAVNTVHAVENNGDGNFLEGLQDWLNMHGEDGWDLKDLKVIPESTITVIFSRDKV